MTVQGLRILPLCMPFAIICAHFSCWWQASGKDGLVHLISLLDGVVCVVGFTALLIRSLGVGSVYVANVLNGVVGILIILGYAWSKNRRFPKKMEELMAVPADFGVPQDDRLDLNIRCMEDVVTISERIHAFCLDRGISKRTAFLAGLSMEEMAGNIVDHGFSKDSKPHSVDVRVVRKGENIILRIKDDCIPFNPEDRRKMASSDDPTKNIGIRLVFRTAKDVQYRNILGLNVVTIRI